MVYRFLLTRRWLGLLAVTLVVAASCVMLGRWQLDRLQERHARNDVVTSNLHAPVSSVDRVLAVGREVPDGGQWQRVRAQGRYDVDHQLVVRNRPPFESRFGYHVLTPFVTDQGPALLVDRGWVAAGETAREVPRVARPPSGEVTIVGRVRKSELPADGVAPPPGQVERIDTASIGATLPYDVYGGYVELVSQRPLDSDRTGPGVRLLPPPQPSDGPHLFYAFQWFLFGGIALVGFVVLARREAQDNAATTPVRQPARVDG